MPVTPRRGGLAIVADVDEPVEDPCHGACQGYMREPMAVPVSVHDEFVAERRGDADGKRKTVLGDPH